MKSLNEELKLIRDSDNKRPPSIGEIEESAEYLAENDFDKEKRQSSKISRLHPECYTTFTFNDINIKSLHEETLFFIFYAIVESDLQIRAYNELIQKGYLFSKSLDGFVFFEEPKVADNKKRKIIYFDPSEWEKCTREIVFDEKFINSLETFITEN